MNDGEKNYFVAEDKVDENLKKGYNFGTTENYKKNIINSMQDTKIMNDGIKNYRIKKDQINNKLDKGWILGKLKRYKHD